MKERDIIWTARILSIVFTPFYLPILGLIVLFTFSYLSLLPLTYKLWVTAIVWFFTILLPSLLINLYRRYKEIPVISETINVLKCMSVAMILSTVLKIFINTVYPDNQVSLTGIVMTAASFYILKKTRCNPIIVMLSCGAINLLLNSLLAL